jgi:hypothetical protein
VARGDSGRVVIDVDPELKRALYVALAMSGSTLKDWFVKQARRHCTEMSQPSLFPETKPEGTEASGQPSPALNVLEKKLSQERHQ